MSNIIKFPMNPTRAQRVVLRHMEAEERLSQELCEQYAAGYERGYLEACIDTERMEDGRSNHRD